MSGLGAGWKALFGALIWLAALWPAPGWAQSLLPVPALTGRVIDSSTTLSKDEVQALDAKLAAFEKERGSQVVVLLVPTTAPEDIAAYAFRVADTWKIGRREVGDGVLVVVAKNDRKSRIEVARALEGAVPDVIAYRIIDQVMTPAFRRGDFAGGLNAAADALMARIRGEDLPLPESGQSGPEEFASIYAWIFVPLALFLPLIFVAWASARDKQGRVNPGRRDAEGHASSEVEVGESSKIKVDADRPYTSVDHDKSDFSSGGGGSFGGGGASGKW